MVCRRGFAGFIRLNDPARSVFQQERSTSGMSFLTLSPERFAGFAPGLLRRDPDIAEYPPIQHREFSALAHAFAPERDPLQ
jgi:hypothetical protein